MATASSVRDRHRLTTGDRTGAAGDAASVVPLVAAVGLLTPAFLSHALAGFAVFQLVRGVVGVGVLAVVTNVGVVPPGGSSGRGALGGRARTPRHDVAGAVRARRRVRGRHRRRGGGPGGATG